MFRVIGSVVVFIVSFAGVLDAQKSWITGRGDRFAGCRMQNSGLVRGRDGYFAVRLKHNQYSGSKAELLLHFNRVRNRRFPVSGSGSIAAQRVLVDRKRPFSGGGSAFFLWPAHYIDIRPGAGSLFLESTSIGSFSIEFRVYPFSNYNGEELFSRYGPFTLEDGRTLFGGMRCVFHRGRLRWIFRNFFRDTKGRARDVVITSRTRVSVRRWQHLAVTYNHFTGKLAILVNGVEDAVRWLTDSRVYGGTPYLAAFHRNLHTYPRIGRSFRGKMDEFRITRKAVRNFRVRRYLPGRGVVLSPVHDMGSSYSRLNLLEAKVSGRGGSAVLMEYRVSDRIFRKDDDRLPWIRVRNGERRFPSGRRGRYIQWRALLLGADGGRYSPQLSQVVVRYSPARKLFRPVGLIAGAGDRRVVLRWTPNMDRIHGYRIYVGTRPGDYLHRNPIRVPLSAINRSRPEFVVYGLENDRLYYFAITAYDRNGLGHESRFSKEVYCRPSFLAGKR